MATIGGSGESYDELVYRNRYGVRSIQAQYLQNEYERMTAAKNAEKMHQKQQKQRQLQMVNQLNDNYLRQINQNRRRRQWEQKSLSCEYEQFIKNKEEKGKMSKHAEKYLEQSTLQAPTWIRDVFAERQTHKKNMQHYNKSLTDHLKLVEIRKDAEKEQEFLRKRKIDQQADAILRRERQELEARHRQKSMFEKRQNDLLGVKSHYNEGIGASGVLPRETTLRRREQDLYSQGLELQLRKEQEKRHAATQEKMATVNTNAYNPITNPLPFVYKNPNVLRMMVNN